MKLLKREVTYLATATHSCDQSEQSHKGTDINERISENGTELITHDAPTWHPIFNPNAPGTLSLAWASYFWASGPNTTSDRLAIAG